VAQVIAFDVSETLLDRSVLDEPVSRVLGDVSGQPV
jgi:hypothetical protein